ncbi:MAG: PadR family transcriptional regulator [Chloroflexota bacterium]
MIEQALLGLLLRKPMHGYELYQALEASVADVCAVNHITQLYPFLRKMKDKGWVTEEVKVQEGRPNRKVFHVTDLGKHEFADWLDRPVRRRREIRDEFLTKLAFSSTRDPVRTLDLLDEQIALYQEYKRELEQARAATERAGSLPTVLAIEAGIRHSQTDIEWAEWCQGEIARRLGSPASSSSDGPSPARSGAGSHHHGWSRTNAH